MMDARTRFHEWSDAFGNFFAGMQVPVHLGKLIENSVGNQLDGGKGHGYVRIFSGHKDSLTICENTFK